jgi:hypothetical protein
MAAADYAWVFAAVLWCWPLSNSPFDPPCLQVPDANRNRIGGSFRDNDERRQNLQTLGDNVGLTPSVC